MAGVAEGFSPWEDGLSGGLAAAASWPVVGTARSVAADGAAGGAWPADAQHGDHRHAIGSHYQRKGKQFVHSDQHGDHQDAIGSHVATKKSRRGLRRGQKAQEAETALGRRYLVGLVWAVVVHGADVEDQDGVCWLLEQRQGVCCRLKRIIADDA